jgi:hypothetical protein
MHLKFALHETEMGSISRKCKEAFPRPDCVSVSYKFDVLHRIFSMGQTQFVVDFFPPSSEVIVEDKLRLSEIEVIGYLAGVITLWLGGSILDCLTYVYVLWGPLVSFLGFCVLPAPQRVIRNSRRANLTQVNRNSPSRKKTNVNGRDSDIVDTAASASTSIMIRNPLRVTDGHEYNANIAFGRNPRIPGAPRIAWD